MKIVVNNKEVDWVENETVKELLKRMKYTFPLVIVKINGKIIPSDKYTDIKIPKKARIQVIHMISGG